MSPLAITGIGDRALDRRRSPPSRPRPCRTAQRVRPCTVTIATPAASARAASSARCSEPSSQPSRIFSVTGTVDRAHHRLDQPQRMIEVAHQRRARQPARDLLRRAAHVDVDDPRALPRAPAARPRPSAPASRPASCTAVRASPRPSSARARRRRASPGPSPLATISDTTRPAPKRSASARNGRSVIPAIGARKTGASVTMRFNASDIRPFRVQLRTI